MLNVIEMSDLWQFKDSLPEGREKELLNNVLFEYNQYMECGSPEECKNRLKWMKMTPEDMRETYNLLAKHMQEEIDYIREKAERDAERKYKPEPKKRGRPKKVKEIT